jgi:hypothetical protein
LSALQRSGAVQRSPSSHDVPVGRRVSAGQRAELPGHCSSMSHWPVAGRHVIRLVLNKSVGHTLDEPVQYSGKSQSPATPRHNTDDDCTLSLPQPVVRPSQ